jgi:rhamnose transport system substrate-binding protein
MKLRVAVALFGVVAIVSGCSSPGASTSAAPPAASPSAVASEPATSPSPSAGGVIKATPGQSVKMMLLPKFLGILPFDQANKGAEEAQAELQNPEPVAFVGPTHRPRATRS